MPGPAEPSLTGELSGNTSAVAFYEKLGWITDEIDPSNYGRDHEDYRILSRAV